MNPRTTAILFLVAAALGAFVWLWGVRGAESRREAEAEAKRLFPGVESEAIRAMALRTSDGRDARVERREGRWRLAEPIDFPGDDAGLDNMASTLSEIQSESVIEEPQPLAVYGLDDAAAAVVRFRVEGEEQERGLRIGAKTPVGASSYVATLEGDDVYVVPTWRTNAFRKSLDDLREARVVRFDRDRVRGIDARWPGGGVELAKGEDGWRLVAPLEDAADEGTVSAFLSDLSFLRADGFVDEPTPADRAALAEPELAVTLELAPGDEPGPAEGEEAAEAREGEEDEAGDAAAGAESAAPRTLRFALGASRDGKQRLARGGDEQALYLVASERLQDFPRDVGAWRFKELARFVATDAQRFELVFHPEQGEPVVIRGERGESGWETEPERMAPARASRLVSELARLEAEDVEADAMGREQLARRGLVPPRAAIRIYGAAGSPAEREEPEEGEAGGAEPPLLAAVDLGELDPELGIAARRADRATVFRASPELAEHVPVSLEAFRNRFLAEEQESEGEATELDEEFRDFLETPLEEATP